MTLFVALSADQIATLEEAAADPFPLALSRHIEDMERTIIVGGFGRLAIVFAGATIALERQRDATEEAMTIALERQRDATEEAMLALRNLGPIVDDYRRIMLNAKPVANPRAPIPAGIRRRNRDRWQ